MLSKEQKDTIIYHIRERGVKLDGCKAVKITIHELNDEMKKHKVFAKEVHEAVKEGNANLADRGKEYLANVIDGELPKSDRNAVTSAIAALNAYEPGFKGTSKVEGTISHDIRVITGIPRPKYLEVEKPIDKPENKQYNIDKEKLRLLNQGASKEEINSIDKAIDNVIDGEIVEEKT
jgi:hypothetical protein